MSLLEQLTSDSGQSKNKTITPQQARQIMDESSEWILLDVRTPNEYAQIRIHGAKLIPIHELSNRAPIELPDKHIPVLIYCHSGARSAGAVKTLTQMGYTNALDFGGIIHWPYETTNG